MVKIPKDESRISLDRIEDAPVVDPGDSVHSVSSDFYPERDLSETYLPLRTHTLFGCLNCEWRETIYCPHGIRIGKEPRSHSNGICQHRIDYLKGFIPLHIQKPSYQEFETYYNHGLGQIQLNSDYFKYKEMGRELQSELDTLREDLKRFDGIGPGDEGFQDKLDLRSRINELRSEISQLRQNWFELTDLKLKYSEKLLSREQPKKLDIKVTKKPTIAELNALVNDMKTVDVELVDDGDSDDA